MRRLLVGVAVMAVGLAGMAHADEAAAVKAMEKLGGMVQRRRRAVR